MPTGVTTNWQDYITSTPVRDYMTHPVIDYDTVTTPDYTATIDTNRYYEVPHIVTSNDLDDFAHRLYGIIKEHTPIDISEEEFMELIMNDG